MPESKTSFESLTLDIDVKEVLTRLSVLMKKPQAAIVNGYFSDMYPALVGLADALEDAENKERFTAFSQNVRYG